MLDSYRLEGVQAKMIEETIKKRQDAIVLWWTLFIVLGLVCLIWNPVSELLGDNISYRFGEFLTICAVGLGGLLSYFYLFAQRGKTAYIHRCRDKILKVVVLRQSATFSCDFCAFSERVVLTLPLTGDLADCGKLTGVTGNFRYHKIEAGPPSLGPGGFHLRQGFDLYVYAQGAPGEATSLSLDELFAFRMSHRHQWLNSKVRFGDVIRLLEEQGDQLRKTSDAERQGRLQLQHSMTERLDRANEMLIHTAGALSDKGSFGRSMPALTLRRMVLAVLPMTLLEGDPQRPHLLKQHEEIEQKFARASKS